MKSVYVVDTGKREVYVMAEHECEAAETVAAHGENVVYAEWFSDDITDAPEEYLLDA